MLHFDGAVHLCYACRKTGRCRLGLSVERLEGERFSRTELTCPAEHEGGPGVAHGGWTTAAMDEVLGHINLLMGQMAVTAELTVEFLRPVPIERPLIALAWCDKVERGRRYNRGELRLAATGAVLARASGVFVERDPSHFERFLRWLAHEDARSAQGSEHGG